MAYEEKSVPSSGPESSISRSPVVCQEQDMRNRRTCRAAALPQPDKVVSLLDKNRNVRHGNPAAVSAALETHLIGIKPSAVRYGRGQEQSGNLCVDGCPSFKTRFCATSPYPACLASRRSVSEPRPPRAATAGTGPVRQAAAANPAAPGDSTNNQHKTDEFVEAAQVLNGPAGNPECVWLGRRVVRLMWRDDLDTAFRHLDLYDRFGCPGGHVQAAFRCLTRFGAQIDDKVQKSLDDHVHACWINPNAQPQAAVAAASTHYPCDIG